MLGIVAFLFMMLVLVLVVSALWTIFTGAPWEPMPLKRVDQMLTMAEVQPGDVVYDLGCGDGRTIIRAARRFGARAVGVEIDPLRYVFTQGMITVLGLRQLVKVLRRNFQTVDLGEATVIAIFLTEQTNQSLEEKFTRELPAGARVITYEFPCPGWVPALHDVEAKLFLYQL